MIVKLNISHGKVLTPHFLGVPPNNLGVATNKLPLISILVYKKLIMLLMVPLILILCNG